MYKIITKVLMDSTSEESKRLKRDSKQVLQQTDPTGMEVHDF